MLQGCKTNPKVDATSEEKRWLDLVRDGKCADMLRGEYLASVWPFLDWVDVPDHFRACTTLTIVIEALEERRYNVENKWLSY